MEPNTPPTSLVAEALAITTQARAAGITQEQISLATGASQSQVSRIMSGRSRRRSRLFIDICKYVDSAARRVTPELVKENNELIEALASVWDGTAHQSATLASIIRSLGALSVTPAKHRNLRSQDLNP